MGTPFLDQLSARRRFGVRPGIGGTRKVLAGLGSPHLSYPVIHVAGTNGKGSTAAMIESMLREGGHRTGLFTSPHLVAMTERVQVNRREASTEQMERWLRIALSADDSLTFFEVLTVAGFIAFAEAAIDVAVVEVGLGGLWDATNVVCPEVTVITAIGLDHADVLGTSLADIALQKAGIMKPGIPAVVAQGTAEVRNAFLRQSAAVGASLIEQGRDFDLSPAEERHDHANTALRYWNHKRARELGDVTLALAGRHQRENAALALAAIDELDHVLPISIEARRRGLSRVFWPGRMETIGSFLLDCAHNPQAVEALIDSLADPRSEGIVFGSLQGKASAEMLNLLRPHVGHVVFPRLQSDRGTPPEDLLKLCPGAQIVESVARALELGAKFGGRVLVTGSSYLVGEARQHLLGDKAVRLDEGDPPTRGLAL